TPRSPPGPNARDPHQRRSRLATRLRRGLGKLRRRLQPPPQKDAHQRPCPQRSMTGIRTVGISDSAIETTGAPRGATESSGDERTLPLVSRSWPMKLGGSLVRGTPGRAGAASDNVRDGLGLSDGPGPASSDGKAYVRNRHLK